MADPRGRTRTMPSTYAELILGRAAMTVLCVVNAMLAAFASLLLWGAAATATGTALASLRAVLIVIPLVWWAFVAFVFVLVVRRRGGPIVRETGAGPEVIVPGGRRMTIALLVVEILCVVLCVTAAWSVDAGWIIVWNIAGLLLAAAAVLTALSAVRPRYLALRAEGLTAATGTSEADLAWGDIEQITLTQGTGGLMVLRIFPRPESHPSIRWRRSLLPARAGIDLEPGELDGDGTLLWMALLVYARDPAARAELRAGSVPARLVDSTVARAATPSEISGPILGFLRPVR